MSVKICAPTFSKWMWINWIKERERNFRFSQGKMYTSNKFFAENTGFASNDVLFVVKNPCDKKHEPSSFL